KAAVAEAAPVHGSRDGGADAEHEDPERGHEQHGQEPARLFPAGTDAGNPARAGRGRPNGDGGQYAAGAGGEERLAGGGAKGRVQGTGTAGPDVSGGRG